MRLRPSLWLGVLAVVAGLVLLVERLIVTDAEAVEALIERAAEAVRQGDFEALADTLEADFTVDGRTGEEALTWIRRLYRNFRPLGIEVEIGEIEVVDDRAMAPTVVSMTVMARPFRFAASVHCQRTDGDWRIVSAILDRALP